MYLNLIADEFSHMINAATVNRIAIDLSDRFVFRGGVFIKIREMEKDSSGFTFRISCAENGLSANGFTRCKAVVNKDNKWYYELDGKLLS